MDHGARRAPRRRSRRRRGRAARIARWSRSGAVAGGRARPPAARRRHHGDPRRGVRRPRWWSRTPPDTPRRAVRRHAATRRTRHRTVPGRAGGGRLPSRLHGIEEPDASTPDAVVVDVLPPDVRTMDLAEARHIVGGGAGLDSAERFTQLARVRPGHRRCDGGHPRDHRSRLGQPRPSDRYHRCGRRPDPVRVVRCERCGAAHERAGRPGAHHQRQHRAALPDDGDVGSPDRERRQRDARSPAGSPDRRTAPTSIRRSTS